jgi:glycerol-3-phosphate acyltransferase PlsX
MEYKKVVIDGFGGDNAPVEVIKGVKKALDKISDLAVVIAGDEQKLLPLAKENGLDLNRIIIVNAPDVISNDDVPTVAIKTKTNSSLVKAFESLKNDASVLGMVSAGSTGAVLTGGFLKVGRIKGVSRPALAPVLPTLKGTPVILIDSGANMDCKPINLIHFALMASKYTESMFGIKNPRIALLSVGTEDHKGNDLVKKTFPYLKQLPINFVGNMEARDLLSGNYDVVVADGFAGNVALKTCEGTLLTLMEILKSDIKSHTLSKLGYVFMKGTFKRLKSKFDYNQYGGSPFLGINKIVIKCHGSSKAESFYQSIKQAYTLGQSNLIQNISTSVNNIDIKVEE